ncbi:UspA domain-containing protein [Burkholderia multivorans]
MNYKTLLVHLDDSSHCEARMNFALDLAQQWDAHLIGLYVVCQDLLQPLFRADESLRLGENEAQHAARQQAVHDRFLAAGERVGRAVEWRAPTGPATEVATLHARHADLLVLGQYDPDEPASYIARNFIEDLLMGSGRPAVVLPYAGLPKTFGENVMIAWDGSREAARAVADALPLLKRARFVTIEAVQRSHGAEADNAPAGIDLAAYLERHGIRASFSATPHVPGVKTGAALLNRLFDVHADLLVMGAYGHTRVHERVLGGVTRTILESMTAPVLMSH